MSSDRYDNPLISRYASPAMSELWGDQRKFSTWRRLWVVLAEAQQELGLAITNEQLAELRPTWTTSTSRPRAITNAACGTT